MSKYAPANDDGLKPYVVERSSWGRKSSKVFYAETAQAARHGAFGRMGKGEYITNVRRATEDDIA